MISINFTSAEKSTALRVAQVIGLTVLLQSCATPSAVSINQQTINAPSQWQTANNIDNSVSILVKDFETWLNQFNNIDLKQAVFKALNDNRDLKAQQTVLAIAKEKLRSTNADKYPEISLSTNNSRTKSISDNTATYQNAASGSLNLSYELDVWGKLSDQQKQSQLNYAAAQADFNQQKVNVVTQVIKQWFNTVEANKLLALYQDRANNLLKNLDMIESSYRLGLGEALDVYLTQNNVASEQARVAEQAQAVKEQTRELELLLGDYPKGLMETNDDLLPINNDFVFTSPSTLLTQRQDIQSSWYQLLALDAGLAVAHKQRFPNFSLSASTGDSDTELSNLLSGNALAWSLIGNITAPIFNGGKLASLEEQSRLAVIRQEQDYLKDVYNAFAEVENVLGNYQSLLKRFNLLKQAETNALAAQKLAFDQYMRGIVTYTTVLESERRAFDAQTTLIQLKNQLIQNRADTFLALGGVINSEYFPEIAAQTNKQDK